MDHDSPPTHARARAATAVAATVQRIETNIASGLWPPGFRLPTERDLERELAVARNTLRKGLKSLENAGKIVRYVGRGSFVAEPRLSAEPSKAQSLLDRVVGSSPAEVMEVRLVLEPWAAALAASRATAGDLAQMRECLIHAEAAQSVAEFEVWDGRLHEVIVSSAKNGLLSGLYEAINMSRHQSEWVKLKERTATPQRRAAYQDQHRQLVEALSDRHGEAAEHLARLHLLDVRRALIGPKADDG